MGKEVRESLKDYYRNHIRELIEKDPEAVVDLFVEQHIAIDTLSKAFEKQRLINSELMAKIQELESQLNQNSHNSHKPPSSDNPYTKLEKKTNSNRKSSGNKPGGQKGHTGHRLEPTDKPDYIIPIKNEGFCECGRNLDDASIIDYVSRQLFDLVLPQLTTKEFCGEVKECRCGKVHKPNFPEYLKTNVQYGPVIKSLAVYFKHHGMISYERIQELFTELFGINLSQGTLSNFINECSKRLEPVTEEIKQAIIASTIVHFDESGCRILGSLHWLHSASTKHLTYYYAHKRRGTEAMEQIGILPNFAGTAIHDHWKCYYTYQLCTHGLCNVHHLRELIYFAEYGEKWAEKFMNCLIDAKKEKDGVLWIFPEKRIKYYKKRLKRILKEGLYLHPKREKTEKTKGRQKQSKQYCFLRRISTRFNDVLRFITDPYVPFSNNQGEQDIRMLKVQQKVSGSFRSYNGAKSFCIIRGYLSTIRKNGQPAFWAIRSAWDSQVIRPSALANAE